MGFYLWRKRCRGIGRDRRDLAASAVTPDRLRIVGNGLKVRGRPDTSLVGASGSATWKKDVLRAI